MIKDYWTEEELDEFFEHVRDEEELSFYSVVCCGE